MLDRRMFISEAVGSASLLLLLGTLRRLQGFEPHPDVDMVIRKNPGCTCCDKWASHLNKYGITTRVEEHPDLVSYKDAMEVPEDLRSCHTGLIDGYVVEGHVPAEDVLRVLEQRPAFRGIAAPGMPIGSPGMESGDRVDPFEVVAFGGAAGAYVYAEHGRQS